LRELGSCLKAAKQPFKFFINHLLKFNRLTTLIRGTVNQTYKIEGVGVIVSFVSPEVVLIAPCFFMAPRIVDLNHGIQPFFEGSQF
jgi:hypothetical protein